MKLITRPLLLLIFLISNAYGQSINGTVICEDKAVQFVNVVVTDSIKNQILAFSVSNSLGNYDLSIPTNKNINLEVRSLHYKPWSLYIDQILSDTIINIQLSQRVSELEEVIVEAKKKTVAVNGDTAKYSISDFLEGEEKVLEDVLKKLPGVTVNELGKIKFQGKEIQTILLEGDDIFEEKYTVGSKNIDVSIIDEVQAIKNHVREKSLQGIKHSSDIVLNLKLREGINSISGNFSLGLGNNDRYQANVSTVNIAKSLKGFIVSDHNNIGELNSPFYFFQNDAFASMKDHRNTPLLSTDMRAEEPRALTLFNRSSYSSVNELFKINNSSIRVQLNHYQDRFERFVFTNNQFEFNGEEISTTQEDLQRKEPLLFDGEIKHTLRNERFDLESKIKISSANTSYLASSLNNNLQINSETDNNDLYYEVSSVFSKKVSASSGLQIQLDVSENKSDEKLLLEGREADSTNTQFNDLRKTFIGFKSSLHHALENAVLRFSVGVTSSLNYLNSFSEGFYVQNGNVDERVFENDIYQNIVDYYIESNSRISVGDNWTLEPLIRISQIHNQFENFIQNEKRFDTKSVVNPQLNIKYKTNPYSFFYLSNSYNQKIVPINRIYEGYIVTSYRTSSSNVFTQDLQKTFSSSFGYSINDYFNLFTLNAGITRVVNFNNFASEIDINENSLNYLFFLQDRSTSFTNVHVMMSKLINPIRTTVTFEGNIGRYTFNNNLGGVDRSNKSVNLNGRLGLTTKLLTWITVSNNLNLFSTEFISSQSNNNTNSSINYLTTATLKPLKNIVLIIRNRYINPSQGRKINYNFVDFEFRYNIKNWNTELSFEGVNLLNESFLKRREVSDYSVVRKSTRLLEQFYMISFMKRF